MFNTPRLGEKLIMLFPIWLCIIGTALAMIVTDPFGSGILAGIALVIFGFVLFFKSKLRRLREGHLTSFGLKELNVQEKKFYIWGYFLMALGLFVEIYLVTKY